MSLGARTRTGRMEEVNYAEEEVARWEGAGPAYLVQHPEEISHL